MPKVHPGVQSYQSIIVLLLDQTFRYCNMFVCFYVQSFQNRELNAQVMTGYCLSQHGIISLKHHGGHIDRKLMTANLLATKMIP